MNDERKWTPGKWYHVGGTDRRMSDYIRVVGEEAPGSGVAVAKVCRGLSTERNANAALISAAPELYEALAAAWEYLDGIPEAAAGGCDDARRIARIAKAALAKARGES